MRSSAGWTAGRDGSGGRESSPSGSRRGPGRVGLVGPGRRLIDEHHDLGHLVGEEVLEDDGHPRGPADDHLGIAVADGPPEAPRVLGRGRDQGERVGEGKPGVLRLALALELRMRVAPRSASCGDKSP